MKDIAAVATLQAGGSRLIKRAEAEGHRAGVAEWPDGGIPGFEGQNGRAVGNHGTAKMTFRLLVEFDPEL